MTETLSIVSLEDALRAKMRQPGGLVLDLTARLDHDPRNDAFEDLAEGVVYQTEAGPSGALRFRRRYKGEPRHLRGLRPALRERDLLRHARRRRLGRRRHRRARSARRLRRHNQPGEGHPEVITYPRPR